MKKIFILLSIFILCIPQTFGQINFGWTQKISPLQWTPKSHNDMTSALLNFQKSFVRHPKMTIIAGAIGAVIMYPSMSRYLNTSRDTNRKTALHNLSLSFVTYYTDNDKYPDNFAFGCVPTKEIAKIYMPNIPRDPKEWHINDGCHNQKSESNYAYRKIFINGREEIILGATMEGKNSGNSKYPIHEIASNPKLLDELSNGTGKYYIVSSY